MRELLRLTDLPPRHGTGSCATTAASRCPRPSGARAAARRISPSGGWEPSRWSGSTAETFPEARIARMDVDTTVGQVGPPADPRPGGARRGRHPPRHADDRQGARLPQGHARRCRERRRRHAPSGLPGVGADLPAAEPGRGRAGRSALGGRGDHPDLTARSLRRASGGGRTTTRASPFGSLERAAPSGVPTGGPARERDREQPRPTPLAAAAAEGAAHWVRSTLQRHARAGRAAVELVGPAPAPIERLHGRWRWHFLLRSPSLRRIGCDRHGRSRTGPQASRPATFGSPWIAIP